MQKLSKGLEGRQAMPKHSVALPEPTGHPTLGNCSPAPQIMKPPLGVCHGVRTLVHDMAW